MQRKTPQISLWLRRKETELEGLSPPWSKSQSCTNNTWKWKSLSPARLCDPVDCNPPGSSVHEVLQARILEWVAISFARGSSQPRGWTWVFCIAGRLFPIWDTREEPTIGHHKSCSPQVIQGDALSISHDVSQPTNVYPEPSSFRFDVQVTGCTVDKGTS